MHRHPQHHQGWSADNPPTSGSWGSLPLSSGQRLNVNPSRDLAWSEVLPLPAGTSWSHHTPSTLCLCSQALRLHSPAFHETHSRHQSSIPKIPRFHSPFTHQSKRATHSQEVHYNSRFDPYILYRHSQHPSLRSSHERTFTRVATDYNISGLSASSDDAQLNQDRFARLLDQSAGTSDLYAHRQDPEGRFAPLLDRPTMTAGALTPIFENATQKDSSHSSSRHTVTHRPWEDASEALLCSSYCRCSDSPGSWPPSPSPSSPSPPTSQFFIQRTKPKKFKPILVYQRPEDNLRLDSRAVEASKHSISNWAGNRSCSPCCSDSSGHCCYLSNCTKDCEEHIVKPRTHKNEQVHPFSDRTSERAVSGSPCLICEESASAKYQWRHKRHQNQHPLALVLNHNPLNFKTDEYVTAELQQNSGHLRMQNESDSQELCRIDTRVAPWLAASTQTLASQHQMSQDMSGISNIKRRKANKQKGAGYRGDPCFCSDRDLSPRRNRVSLPVAVPFMSQPNLAQLSHYPVRETNNRHVSHNRADIHGNINFCASMTHLPTSTSNFSVFRPTLIPRILTHESQSPLNKPSRHSSFSMMDQSAKNRSTLPITPSETSPNSQSSFPATPSQDSFTPQVSCPRSPQDSCHETSQDSLLMTPQSCPVTPQNLVPLNSIDSCPETHADPLAACMENQSSATPFLLSDCDVLRPSSLPVPNYLQISSSVTCFSATERTTNLMPVNGTHEISPSGTNRVSEEFLTQNAQVVCPVTMTSNAVVSGDEIHRVLLNNDPVYSQSSSQLSTNTLVSEISGAGSFQHPSQPVAHCSDSKNLTSETAAAKKCRSKRAFSCADFNISVLDFEDLLTPRVNLNQLASQSMVDLSQISEEALEFAPGPNNHSSRKIPKTAPGVNKCPRLLSALSVPNLHIPVTSSTTQPNVTPNKIPQIPEVPELHIPEEIEARVLNTPMSSMHVLTSPTSTSVVETSSEASFVLPLSPIVQATSVSPVSMPSVTAAIPPGATTMTRTTVTALSCPTASSDVHRTSALSLVPAITPDIPMTSPAEGDDWQEWSQWKSGGSFLQMLNTNDQPADGNNYRHPPTPLSRMTPHLQDFLPSRVGEHSHLIPFDFAASRVDQSPSFLHTTVQRDHTPSLPTVPLDARGDKGKRESRRYRCPYCGMVCTSQGQLRGHLRVHTGEKPFRCECGRAFARNEELTRHRRIHLGLRPFTCPTCSKSFGRKDHLSKHEKTHLGNNEKKVHGCQVPGCGQVYSRSDALARHQWSSHGIRAKTARLRTPGQSEDGDESSLGSPMF